MKQILTGLCNNIAENRAKIKVWSESFRKYSDGDIILIAANTTEEDIQTCIDLNIKYFQVTVVDTWHINNKRLKHTKDFLKQSDGDLFMITDVFDVVFQANPFNKMDLNNYDVFISKEGVLVSEEPWNADVIMKVFPDDVKSCMQTEIVCSGVIGGKKDALINLYDKMDYMCENSSNAHNIKDQAALIVMVKNNEIERLRNFSLNDGWAMHCATSGPTDFFIPWGFKGIIGSRYNIPTMINDKVCTSDGRVFDIVHQFNRVSDWKKILTRQYE